MRVRVDEAGRGDAARSVDLGIGARVFEMPDGGDAATGDEDVRFVARRAHAVDDRGVADHEFVVHGRMLPFTPYT